MVVVKTLVTAFVPDASGTFSVTASGLIFDFAAQTISPVPTSFRDDANPTSTQLSELSASSSQILDRMYSFAKGIYLAMWTDLFHF